MPHLGPSAKWHAQLKQHGLAFPCRADDALYNLFAITQNESHAGGWQALRCVALAVLLLECDRAPCHADKPTLLASVQFTLSV